MRKLQQYLAVLTAWKVRVKYHDQHGRPHHSRRVLLWNRQYVLYDLHLPPAVALPSDVIIDKDESVSGGVEAYRRFSTGRDQNTPKTNSKDIKVEIANPTSACGRGTSFRSNGALISPNGRYTFVQHNGRWPLEQVVVVARSQSKGPHCA